MAEYEAMPHLESVLDDVAAERGRQHEAWGEQNWRDGTSGHQCGSVSAATIGAMAEKQARLQLEGTPTFAAIFGEEFGEALQESDKGRLEVELIQCAAVAVAWIEKLRREKED